MSPEELLTHAPFVHGLARSLVFDEHQSADVVQQVWLAAIENPPDGTRPIRPWLSRVIRNISGKMRLGDYRRGKRERRAAVPLELPAASEEVEQGEILDRVVSAVLALEEPYRSAILQRYYEDLPPRRIAARAGIPVATVKTRLRRGLERLRGRLDASCGGNRREWCRALIPLAGWKTVVGTGAAGAGQAGASFLTGALAKSAAVFLLAAAAVLIIWTCLPPGPVALDPGRAMETPSILDPGSNGDEHEEHREIASGLIPPPEETLFEIEPIPSAGHVVVGRVLDRSGLPLADVSVEFAPGGRDMPAPSSPALIPKCRTDEAGRYEFHCRLNGRSYGWVLFRHDDHCDRIEDIDGRSNLTGGGRFSMDDVHLEPALFIDIRVVDEAGQPVAGCCVEEFLEGNRGGTVSPFHPASGEGLLSGGTALLTDGEGRARLKSEISDFFDGIDRVRYIVARKAGAGRGIIWGVRYGDDGCREIVLSKTGIEAPARRSGPAVSATGEGGVGGNDSAERPGQSIRGRLILADLARYWYRHVLITKVDRGSRDPRRPYFNGEGIRSHEGEEHWRISLEEDGSFASPLLPAGSYDLSVHLSGLEVYRYGPGPVLLSGEADIFSLGELPIPPPTGTVRGVVTDRSGGPPEGIVVVLMGPGGIINYTCTDERGAYLFSGLPPGNYLIDTARVTRTECWSCALPVPSGEERRRRPDGDGSRITLGAGSVRLFDCDNRKSWNSVLYYSVQFRGGGSKAHVTDVRLEELDRSGVPMERLAPADGDLFLFFSAKTVKGRPWKDINRFTNLRDGLYRLTAFWNCTFNGEEIERKKSVPVRVGPGLVDDRIEKSLLIDLGEIRGTVLDAETGNPIPFARIRLATDPGDANRSSLTGRSREDGSFAISRIAAGYYSITIQAAGYRDHQENISANSAPPVFSLIPSK